MENSQEQENTISPRSIGFLLFLTLLNAINMIDRQLLASFANYIVPDLQLTNTQYGLLTGILFLFFYSVMGLFMGLLADTVNRTRLIAVGLAFWSALTALSGAARGFVSLAVPRMFIGVGESILTPSAMSLIADRFPASRLGLASGIYYIGAPIGGGLSFLIAGYLGPILGWRNCFYILGAIGLLLAAVMWKMKEPARRNVATGTKVTEALSFKEVARTAVRIIPKSPALMATIAGGMAFHLVLGAAMFEQLWFVQERGFERSEIAQMTGWIGIVAGILGNLFGGYGSDWFTKKTGLGRPMFLFWILLAISPFMLALRLGSGDSIWIPIGLFFGFFQLGAFYGPVFATIQELAPPTIRSTVVALFILAVNLVGVGLGVTFAGVAIDVMIAQGVDQPYSVVLLIFTLLSFLAMPCFLYAGLRCERDRERLYSGFHDESTLNTGG